jgi:3-oxoacyl-[acyl-carrier-protein] synthase III
MLPDIYVAGLGSCWPHPTPVAEAVAAGHYDRAEADRTEYVSVCVDDKRAAPELAVLAAADALATAGMTPDRIETVFYGHGHRLPLDFWNPAGYLARELNATGCALMAINGGCAAGLGSVQVACAYLAAGFTRTALVTAADCWPAGQLDRYRANSGIVFADGAAAAVLTRTPGPLRILSAYSTGDPQLEGLHRGDDEWYTEPPDANRRARAFRAVMPPVGTKRHLVTGLRAAVSRVLADAAAGSVADLALVLLPGVGTELFTTNYLGPLGIDAGRTNLAFSRTTGHFGAADQLAALAAAVSSGDLTSGDLILLVGEGTGFSWSTAVIQVA